MQLGLDVVKDLRGGRDVGRREQEGADLTVRLGSQTLIFPVLIRQPGLHSTS